MRTGNRVVTIVLAGGLIASAAYAQDTTALEKQLADLRSQIQAVNKQLSDRDEFLKAQAPIAELVTASATADTALSTLRKSEKVVAIESARNKASQDYTKALEDAKKASAEYTALRAKEKEAKARQSAADIKPEAKDAISKELADITKQKADLVKSIEAQPAVAAAKTAADAANTAYQQMTTEAEYAKLQQTSNEARNALNKAMEDARKSDATYVESKGKRDGMSKQIRALEEQVKAAKVTK